MTGDMGTCSSTRQHKSAWGRSVPAHTEDQKMLFFFFSFWVMCDFPRQYKPVKTFFFFNFIFPVYLLSARFPKTFVELGQFCLHGAEREELLSNLHTSILLQVRADFFFLFAGSAAVLKTLPEPAVEGVAVKHG